MPVARLNGIDINYEVHGDRPGARIPLVLTHGYSASLEMWREQVPALSSKYRLVIYDTRGHGATTAPEDMDQYSLARDYVADKLALMDHLGVDKAYVGGLSMGGMIAQEFTLQHPDRVSALLLFDTGPGMGAAIGARALDAARVAQFQKMREMLQNIARTQGMGAIIDSMRTSPAMFKPAAGAPIPAAVRTHVANMKEMSVDGYLGGGKSMQDWPGTLERLHTITVPSLVLVGEQDNLLPASQAIHARIPGSRFVLLRNSGHGTNMWRPDAFTTETVDFLAAVDAGDDVSGEFVVP